MSEAPDPEGFRQHRFVTPPGATRVLLVRHGESAAAMPGQPFPLNDGHGDPPLHSHGLLQADLVAERLKSDASIAAIYVTTLQRTHQTAAPLAAALGLAPITVADLREVHLGDWEGGQLRVRAAAGDPILAEMLERQRWDVIPGAEAHGDFDARLQRGLASIVARHPDQTVVAVVHGGVIGQLLAAAVGITGFAFTAADNASISEIVVQDTTVHLRRFNDTAHLE